jgi:hypothetical protein
MSGQLHATSVSSPGEDPSVLIVEEVGDPQNQFGCGGEEKNPVCAGNRTLVVQPVA